MLNIGGKDVIYSGSFLVAQGEPVELNVPGIIARSIKVIAQVVEPGAEAFKMEESDNQVTITVPFGDQAYNTEFGRGQLVTKKGPVTGRIFGQPAGKWMLINLDIHEGRYDNYVEE